MNVTYPDVTVQFTNQDGNVFNLIGLVRRGIQTKHGREAAVRFVQEATSCEDYSQVLQLCFRTVVVT